MRKIYSLAAQHAEYVKAGGKMPKALFKNVVQEFNQALVEELLEGRAVYLPYGLSSLRIMRFKRKDGKLLLDHNATRKAKQALIAKGIQPWDPKTRTGVKYGVFHLNEHTDQWVCKIFWDAKNKKPITGGVHYRLIVSRRPSGPKGQLARLLKDDPLHVNRFKSWR